MSQFFRVVCLFAIMSLTFAQVGFAQVDNSVERKERIKSNLQFLFPELQKYSVDMGDITSTDTPGMEQGSFTINGQQVQNFLTSSDDEAFYLLTAGPFAVNKSAEELELAVEEREAEALAQARDTHEALMGIVGDMPVRGNADTPVTIIEFSDFECPYCADASAIVKEVLDKYEEDVNLIYVQFPLESIHPWARTASIASLCAAQQDTDAFWTLHDEYFSNQDAIEVENIVDMSTDYLAESGIDMDAWNACTTDENTDAHAAAVAVLSRSLSIAEQFGVSSTPGFFINGRFISGAQPVEIFSSIIEEAKGDVSE